MYLSDMKFAKVQSRISEKVHFTEMTVPSQSQDPFMIAISMSDEGLRVHELKDDKDNLSTKSEIVTVPFPSTSSNGKESMIDFQILQTVKRNSDTSVYIALLSSQSVHVCELILSLSTMQYKILHIKEITLSIKLYSVRTKWIELPASNMEQKTSTLVILDMTYNQLLVVVIDVTEADYLGRAIILI